jgi:hypothetical protein
MTMSRSIIWSAVLGAAQGAFESAIMFATSERYSLSKDWFLAVMIVFANATGFAICARYGVSLIGVAVAGLAGMVAGGWVGEKLIGSYEYRVPTPREQRVMRIVWREGEKEIALPGVPAETVRRIPVGGGIGVLAGWVAGAFAFAQFSRSRLPGGVAEEGEEDP